MSKKSSKPKLLLTDRALSDIASIEDYSIATWGKRTAARYIDDLQSALDRIKQNPGLLCPEPEFHDTLCFHPVNKHVLVCDVQDNIVFVLTLLHASMDIPSRLSELAPSLVMEAEMLAEQLGRRRKRGR